LLENFLSFGHFINSGDFIEPEAFWASYSAIGGGRIEKVIILTSWALSNNLHQTFLQIQKKTAKSG
jgi:hypothetical protein